MRTGTFLRVPLTVTEAFSRYLLECHGLLSTNVADTKFVLTRLFKEYELPEAIRTREILQRAIAHVNLLWPMKRTDLVSVRVAHICQMHGTKPAFT